MRFPADGMAETPLTDRSRRHFVATGAARAVGALMLGHGLLDAQAAPASMASASAASSAGQGTDAPWQNWSGLQRSAPASFHFPADEAGLAQWMRGSRGELRAVGAGHSFTALVPTAGAMVSLDQLSGLVAVDRQKMQVRVKAGTRLGVLARALDDHGLALRNLPDIDVQSLAGAISTGTHGTGAALPALHADVVGLRIVKPDGQIAELHEDLDRDAMAAARVSLGSFGLISEMTLKVLPAYNLHRRVWLEPIDKLLARAPQLARQHRHFEFYYLPFTGYAAGISHDLYTGQDLLLPASQDEAFLDDLRMLRDWLGRFPALRTWVAQKFIDPDMKEEARHRAHRLLSTVRPMRFNETEWHVPRERGIDCLREIIRTIERRNEVFFPMEFRFTQADDAWLSPFHGRDSCSIAVHAAVGEAHDYLLTDCTPVFATHGGRPHWGKLHPLRQADLARLYPRWREFLGMRQRFDPQGRMLNAHLRQLFF
ncbi:MAG: D-arabinono-1,4-lactone oxidase [Aquabacterium sp.]